MALVRRLLAKSPEDRYASAADVRAGLARLASSAESIDSRARQARRVETVGMGRAGDRSVAIAGYLFVTSDLLRPSSRAPAWRRACVIRSIAVLPLDNYSGDPSQDYFAEGMTDELTADLATISQLRVISRGSVMQFKGKDRPPTPEIARKLNVDAVVEGSVSRSGDKVRITAQLIDARADKHLWAKSFERSSRDVLALQAELASAIAREINVQLTLERAVAAGGCAERESRSARCVSQGSILLQSPERREPAESDRAIRGRRQVQSNFCAGVLRTVGCVPLGRLQRRLSHRHAKRGPRPRRQPKKPSNWTTIPPKRTPRSPCSSCSTNTTGRAASANSGGQSRSTPTTPSRTISSAWRSSFQGRFDEAIAEGKRAIELDPLSPADPRSTLPSRSCSSGTRAPAKELARKAAELDPTYFFPVMVEGWTDLEAGKFRDAIPALRKAKAMESPPFVTAYLAFAYGAAGDREAAMVELGELKKMSRDGTVLPFNLALVYLGLGDHARALDNLEKALRGRFADDGVDRSGCDLRSHPLRAAFRGAREEDGHRPLVSVHRVYNLLIFTFRNFTVPAPY